MSGRELHPEGGHRPPPPGYDQPLRPAPGSTRQGGGGGGFVTVNDRLFAPLQGLDKNNVLQGGYNWLSVTSDGVLHPGLDLNAGGSCGADAGNAVVAPLAGIVRAALPWDGYTPGEGSHVWLELSDPCCPGPSWFHVDHLLDIACAVGQRLAPGEPIGLCGKSGGWSCEHAHVELLVSSPRDGWWQWPVGWSRAQVEAAYWNPWSWWDAAKALVLAEGNQPIPPEVVMFLEDWQVRNWILGPLYAAAGIAYNPDSGTAQAWVDRLRDGHYVGRPRSAENPYGEGDQAGVWVEFDRGVCLYRLGDGQVSWNG